MQKDLNDIQNQIDQKMKDLKNKGLNDKSSSINKSKLSDKNDSF